MDQSVILLLIGLMALLLIFTIFLLVIYSGLLSDVNVGVGKPPISEVVVYYKFGRGSYRDIMGTSYIFTEVTSIVPKNKCFGVYYDSPDKVPAEKLRWAVGAVVRENNGDLDPAVVDKLRSEGYKEFCFPKVENVVKAEFPCRTPISVLLGVYKVYPRLEEYIKEKRLCAHPWLEIYDGETVHFIAPLSKQESFYVPEALAKPQSDKSDIRIRNKRTKIYSGRDKQSLSESSEVEIMEENCDMKQINDNCSKGIENKMSQLESLSKPSVNSANNCKENIGDKLEIKDSEFHHPSEMRSKSVNVLIKKEIVLPSQKNRSQSLAQFKSNCKSSLVNSSGKIRRSEKDETVGTGKLCDSDTPIANYSGLESLDPDCSMDSLTCSINSTNDTRESSYYSSEYSYTSESSINSATCTEISSDSDNTEDASSVIMLKEKDRKKTPEN